MAHLLDFQFLAILNLFIGILWPASGLYFPLHAERPRFNAAHGIVTVLTALAVLLDIVFLVLKAVH